MKNKIDLTDIKENDLDKTSSFTDLMTRKERKNRKKTYDEFENKIKDKEIKDDFDDIEEMVSEKKRSTKDLTLDIEKAKEKLEDIYDSNDKIKEVQEIDSQEKVNQEEKEETLAKTQLLELTRQMKLNLEETKHENKEKKRKGVSVLNIIGEVNLLCIGYYIYLLVFTSFQDKQQNYLINGGLIVSLVLLFGLSIITRKNVSKFFNILNIFVLVGFIIFNAYTLMN